MNTTKPIGLNKYIQLAMLILSFALVSCQGITRLLCNDQHTLKATPVTSKEEAIAIAESYAKFRNKRVENYDIESVKYVNGEWRVHYQGIEPVIGRYTIGNFFYVIINGEDKSDLRIVEGR